jgi:hypothetical protein
MNEEISTREEFLNKLSDLFREYEAELIVEREQYGYSVLTHMEIYIPAKWEGEELVREYCEINLGNKFE